MKNRRTELEGSPGRNARLATILRRLRQRFEELYGDLLVKMVLYGSQARGDARPYSDIDVLVVLRGPVRPGEEIERTGGIVSELSLEFDAVIECVFVDETRFLAADTPLIDAASREGVPV